MTGSLLWIHSGSLIFDVSYCEETDEFFSRRSANDGLGRFERFWPRRQLTSTGDARNHCLFELLLEGRFSRSGCYDRDLVAQLIARAKAEIIVEAL